MSDASAGATRARVCYHVQSHRLPGQVLRLVRCVKRASPTSIVLVSHDVAGEPLDAAAFASLPDVHLLPARGGYGDFSHLDRWLETVDWLDRHAPDVGWLCTLSGQDYPVRPLEEVEAFLAATDADGFLEHWPVFSPEGHWSPRRASTRYLYRHVRLRGLTPARRRLLRALAVVNLAQPLVRVNAAYGSLAVRTRTPFGPGFALYGGSFFCTLSRPCVDYVRDECRRRPELVAYLRRVLAPEEVFFQTLLVNSGRFRLDPDPHRYFDFSDASVTSPKTLTSADLPRVTASSAHFARKVDVGVDASVLDRLDERVLAPVR